MDPSTKAGVDAEGHGCPFLGMADDSATSLAFPSNWNYCYRCKPIAVAGFEHQRNFCLVDEHLNCPVFLSGQDAPMPEELHSHRKSRARRKKAIWTTVIVTVIVFIIWILIWWQTIGKGQNLISWTIVTTYPGVATLTTLSGFTLIQPTTGISTPAPPTLALASIKPTPSLYGIVPLVPKVRSFTPFITPVFQTTASTPIYLATYYSPLSLEVLQLAGNWSGKVAGRINNQKRPSLQINVIIRPNCYVGIVCGEYRTDSPCYGNLIFVEHSGKTFNFKGHDLSGDDDCGQGDIYKLKLLSKNSLSLSVGTTNRNGKKITRSGTLFLSSPK